MVCALPPRRFLAGEQGCGDPLDDVALRIDPGTSAVEVRTARLSPGWLEAGVLRPLPCRSGNWWRSGDSGWLGPDGLVVRGRLDGAILSGGETVFPEQLESRLQEEAARHGLPLEAVLLLAAALARRGSGEGAWWPCCGAGEGERLLQALREVVASWPAAERPRSWTLCPDLIPNPAGKWERPRWCQWLIHHHPALPGG
jgi:O-succinylbenzoic acid--CoA ligase